jgi:hypothetical protein
LDERKVKTMTPEEKTGNTTTPTAMVEANRRSHPAVRTLLQENGFS